MALNAARVSAPIEITENQFSVPVEFYDSADAATVIWAETVKMTLDSSVAQLAARVTERGQAVRALLAKRDAARVAVPVSTSITIP